VEFYFLQTLFPVFNALHPAEHLDVEHDTSAVNKNATIASFRIELLFMCLRFLS